MKWRFTTGTPARVSLQLIGISFLGYSIMILYNAQTTFELVKGLGIFIAGTFLFILREHVSNSDYFTEFDKHLHEKYDVLPVEPLEDEPNGYA